MDAITERTDLSEETKREKMLPFAAKYRGILAGCNGREEERRMRSEWD